MTALAHLLVIGEASGSCTSDCPACGFTALLHFPVYALDDDGVAPYGVMHICGRCYQDAIRAAREPRDGD